MGKEKPSKRRLKTMDNIRCFLADTINKLNRDEIDAAKATKLGYLCQILAKVIREDDFESRLNRLETIMEKK